MMSLMSDRDVSTHTPLEELVETVAIGMMSLMNDRTFSRHTPGGACLDSCHWHDELDE